MRSIQDFNNLKKTYEEFKKLKLEQERKKEFEATAKKRLQATVSSIEDLEKEKKYIEEIATNFLSENIDQELSKIAQEEITEKDQRDQKSYQEFRSKILELNPEVNYLNNNYSRLLNLNPNLREGIIDSLYIQKTHQDEQERLDKEYKVEEREKLMKILKKSNPEYRKLSQPVLDMVLEEIKEQLEIENDIIEHYKKFKDSGSISEQDFIKFVEHSNKEIFSTKSRSKSDANHTNSENISQTKPSKSPEIKKESPKTISAEDKIQNSLEKVHSRFFPANFKGRNPSI
jgi:hypothetical protein